MVLDSLPGDPPARSVLDALGGVNAAWEILNGPEHHFEAQAALRSEGHEAGWRWTGPLVRKAQTSDARTRGGSDPRYEWFHRSVHLRRSRISSCSTSGSAWRIWHALTEKPM